MVVVEHLAVFQGDRTDHLAEGQVQLKDHLKSYLAVPGDGDQGQVVAGEGAYQGVVHLQGKLDLAGHLGEHLGAPVQVGDLREWAHQEMEDGERHLGDHFGGHLVEGRLVGRNLLNMR